MLIVRKKSLILLILLLVFSTSYVPQALSFVVPEAPADLVDLFGSTTTGQITSFKRIMPDGTSATFTIPPGQILVIKLGDKKYELVCGEIGRYRIPHQYSKIANTLRKYLSPLLEPKLPIGF